MTEYDASFDKRKRIVLIGFSLIILVLAAWFVMPMVRADSPSSKKESYNIFKGGVKRELSRGMYDRIKRIFGSEAKTSDNEIEQAATELNDFMETFQDSMVGVGLIFVIVASFITLFRELQRGEGGLDVWTKYAVVMCIGAIVVIHYNDIIGAAEGIGQLFVESGEAALGSSAEANSLSEWIDSTFDAGEGDIKPVPDLNGSVTSGFGIPEAFNTFRENVGFTIELWRKRILLTALLVVVELAMLPGYVSLYSIWIEIFIRKAFFPVAIADIVGQGARSPGVAYIRKFISVYIRVAMCFVISAVGNSMIGKVAQQAPHDTLDGALRLMTIAVLYLTVSNLYAQTASIANQVAGV